ncbi:MAG: NAD-dependent epimerase/dehydratase family protein, partial [Ignavibacteriales bacterium]
MKISITGATGFIGRHLVQKHLEMNDEIKILTRREPEETGFGKNVQIYKADLLDGPDALSAFVCGADILYHCAAGLKDVSLTYQANVEGTANLIRAASGRIGHWVQLSSVGVYGMHASGVVTESTPADPHNYYERSKLESDRLVRNASAADGFTFSILRPSIVFGRGMKNRSLFQLTEMVDRGLFFFAGPPGASANYIPVENVVNALILCA